MAQQGVQQDQEQFCCSICLDLLKDPVSVPCGHSYCMGCIEGFWDQDDQKGLYSCPQCRETFNPRPVLKKNNMLADMMELLKKTGLQAVPPDLGYAGPGDVACDFCTGRKVKAVKTCLQCLVSYCDTHLQPHYQLPAFKKHKLVTASSKLQENTCSLHDEVKKVFCRTDQQCICYLCCMEEHKGHDTISAAAERTERQKELDTSQQNIQQRIQEREKDVKVLHQDVESINQFADRAVKDSDTVFTELISSIERKRSEVREQIRDQQKHEVSRAEEQRKVVEQEVTELRRSHAELEQISHTEDPIHFLNSYTSLSKISESTHPVISSVCHFEDVTISVSKIKDKLEDILKAEGTNLPETVHRVDVLQSTPPEPQPGNPSTIKRKEKKKKRIERSQEPKTRCEFLQYSCPLTLDPNTAHERLSLTKGNRKVTRMNRQRPERFTICYQVLSVERLTGRCYWEVKWSGNKFGIAVSCNDIDRTGTHDEIGFGMNSDSFFLQCQAGSFHLRFNSLILQEGIGHVSSRIGVYMDPSVGTLSFYSITADTMTLMATVNTSFIQDETIYAGLWTAAESTVELCDLN